MLDGVSLKHLEQLNKTMTRITTIPEKEWEAFTSNLSEKSFDRKDYIIRAGEISNHLYFIAKGLVRFFYITLDGKEFNKHFAMENGFAGSYHSLLLKEPCGFYIQTLERTTAILIPHHVITAFYDRHPCWERLGRKNAEYMFLFKEAREKELLLDSLETRYQTFLKDFPGLTQRIAQYHIASYLGGTDVALSRIRNKI